jgi:hypothetical protein
LYFILNLDELTSCIRDELAHVSGPVGWTGGYYTIKKDSNAKQKSFSIAQAFFGYRRNRRHSGANNPQATSESCITDRQT